MTPLVPRTFLSSIIGFILLYLSVPSQMCSLSLVVVATLRLLSDDRSVLLGDLARDGNSQHGSPASSLFQPPDPKKKHGGKKYQARCLEILQWLHAEGDIATLVISPES